MKRAAPTVPLSEKGVRLAQKMKVGPCIPVGMQLYKAEVGQTSGPTWHLSHLGDLDRHRPRRVIRLHVERHEVRIAACQRHHHRRVLVKVVVHGDRDRQDLPGPARFGLFCLLERSRSRWASKLWRRQGTLELDVEPLTSPRMLEYGKCGSTKKSLRTVSSAAAPPSATLKPRLGLTCQAQQVRRCHLQRTVRRLYGGARGALLSSSSVPSASG